MAAEDMLAWLRRQVERDLKAAKAASASPWEIGATAGYCGREITIVGEHTTTSRYEQSTREYVAVPTRKKIIGPGYEGGGVWARVDADHIQRHDPRDTLARCEAELALIARSQGPGEPGTSPEFWGGMFEAILMIAAGYQHREGFNPAWLEG